MKHWLRLALCAGALAALLTCGASAAEMDYTTNVNGTVTYDSVSGKYTASCSDVQEGNQYALLVVKYDGEDTSNYSISEDTIMYIDQMAADSSGVSFDFIPRSTPDCVVLLGGEFSDDQSPKVLGTLIGQGVTVSGTIQLNESKTGAVVTLYSAQGDQIATTNTDTEGNYSFNSVPVGENYKIVVTKSGYCSYTITGISVQEECDLGVADVKTLAGDVNGNNEVNGYDLTTLLADFNHVGDQIIEPRADLNETGEVNGYDLALLLSNFNASSVEMPWTE